ncbi:MAG: hypothetical protein ACWIPJ_10115 [Polaribacter sp.]
MKKISLIFSVILLSVLFIKCTKQNDKTVSDTLFNIENIKNISVNSFEDENLNKQGYKREVADVLIYEKKVRDTLVQLQFTDELVLYKTWYIKLDSNSKTNRIDEILYTHSILALSNFDECEKNKKPYSFPALDDDNNIFLCNVYKEDNVDYLKIVYYNPTSK